MPKALFAIFLAALSLPASTLSAQTTPAAIWYTEEFTVHSQAVGQDFLIQVSKPVRPQTGKVPVVYLLDGNSLFGIAANMAQSYGYYGDTAAAYIVGIGYPAADYAQWTKRRGHDYIHQHLAAPLPGYENSGGGASFQKFVVEELQPLIAKRYPVDPQRSYLAGHSYGGLFALHVLLNSPAAFNGYIVCSPSLWAEPQLLDKASALRPADVPKVYLSVGAKEQAQFGDQAGMVKNAEKMAAILQSHSPNASPNTSHDGQVLFSVFEGKNHGTSIASCLSGGLEFLLSPPAPATR